MSCLPQGRRSGRGRARERRRRVVVAVNLPQPVQKICRTMSACENPVRRSDARPMRPAETRRQTMRVMVLVKATDDSEKGFFPTPEAMEAMGAMGKFTVELRNSDI